MSATTTSPLKTVKPVMKKLARPEYPTLGCDPELMIFDLQENKMVSAIRLLENDKHSPIKAVGSYGPIEFYADNVLVEFRVVPGDVDMVIRQVQQALQAIQDKLGKRYRLVAKAAHHYPKEELDDPRAWEIGCTPSMNVYTGEESMPGEFKDEMRTGSFHIHIGIGQYCEQCFTTPELVRQCDYAIGTQSVAIDTDPSSLDRRKIYGKAGEYRETPYGLEYRVLGPFFLRSPDLLRTILKKAYRIGMGKTYSRVSERTAKACRTTIDTCDQMQGESYIKDVLDSTDWPSRFSPDLYRDWSIKIR